MTFSGTSDVFVQIWLKFLSNGPFGSVSTLSSYTALASNRQHAITITNVGPINRRIYVSVCFSICIIQCSRTGDLQKVVEHSPTHKLIKVQHTRIPRLRKRQTGNCLCFARTSMWITFNKYHKWFNCDGPCNPVFYSSLLLETWCAAQTSFGPIPAAITS